MSRLDEIRELTWVRVLSFLREPEAIFWVFVFPMVLAAVLGFAFRSQRVAPSKVGVLEGPGAAALVEIFEAREELEVEAFETREDGLLELQRGNVDGLIEVSASAEGEDVGDVESGGADGPKLTFDPVRAEAETARLRVLRALSLAEGARDPPLEEEQMTERGSRYVDFLFPGLIGMNLMGTGMWGIGFAIADLRRRKFLRRLMVTPMRRSSFFASFIFSRLVFLVLEVVVLTSFAAWILGVPFRGDVVSFAAITVLGAMSFAGLGILTVARVRTIEGASGLMNFVMMPMWLASGVFFSYERFPDALHPVLRLLPLTALNDALRAIMLDGQSVLTQGPEVAVVAAWCVITFVVALRIFRWE